MMIKKKDEELLTSLLLFIPIRLTIIWDNKDYQQTTVVDPDHHYYAPFTIT